MKLCCVPGCSVGYELGIHVALRPLRQSVLLVMLVFDCCPREYPAMYVASIIVLCTGFVSQTRKLSVQCVVLGVSTVLYSADSTFRPLPRT